MNVRKVIEHISKNDERLRILQALRERPATPSKLADRQSVERTPVYTAIEPLEQWGAVFTIGGQRKLSASGDIAVHKVSVACDEIGRERIAYIAHSTDNNRIKLLQTLERPTRKANLARQERLPSRSTVSRILSDFDGCGWITDGPEYELTESGETALRVYSKLEQIIGIVLNKSEYLRHVDPFSINLPIELLADGEVIRSTPSHPQRTDEVVRETIREGFDHLRVLSTYYVEEGLDEIKDVVKQGATVDAITPRPAHITLPTNPTELKDLQYSISTDRYNWQIYPDDLPIDLSIYDRRIVIIGSNPNLENPRTSAVLRSENEELIEWAINLHESHKEQASSAISHFLPMLRKKGLDKILRGIGVRG